jgi:subtilisin family serine protease
MKIRLVILTISVAFLTVQISGQNGTEGEGSAQQWHHKDFETDNVPGVSTIRAYEEVLKEREPGKIIVAVLDDGIDISHEDLKGRIWTNQDEIPANGIDDDGNGYVDDIHGWNFLGNAEGENLIFDTYELTRIYARMHDKFDEADTSQMNPEESKQYTRYLDIKGKFESEKEESDLYYKDITEFKAEFDRSVAMVEKHTDADELNAELLDTLKIRRDRKAKKARKKLYRFYSYGYDESIIEEAVEYLRIAVDYHYNPEFNSRPLIGDDPEDLDDRSYGNPQVFVEGQTHGTSVSALIGAVRSNGLGIDGIAPNVELMPVRIIPDGDERDKDVANGIYYAVDNGAKVLNMSFGKGYSPDSDHVKRAIRYAEEKGVLMVTGSGNDGQDNDSVDNYPNKYYSDGTECKTWISVGATSKHPDSTLVTDFSNYGKTTVDLMAPGENVMSLAPGDTTEVVDGTSFSSPIVAGVAALVWSYFPELTAAEIRTVLMQSSTSFSESRVLLPGTMDQMKGFGELSVTGGIVNAYKAVLLADKIRVTGSLH